MKGGTVTIQLSALETSEPRLLTDIYKQNLSDSSFSEKLKTEKERIGLLFSPLSQWNGFFAYPLELTWMQTAPESDQSAEKIYEQSGSDLSQPSGSKTNSEKNLAPITARVFESAGSTQFNRQFLQELLAKTNWLVPNLAAQPEFNLAFQAGQLAPKFDLQALIDQLLEQVKLVKSKNQTELSLTLKPEDLGEIFLNLTSLSGKVSITIAASPETKKLIDSQKEELGRALKKANVNLGELTIKEVENHV